MVSPPPRSAITDHVCDECEEITEFFRGKPWTDFDDVTALRYHSDALFLFAPAAYHYYLPAFIRATLRDEKAADLIPDVIFSTIRVEFGNSSRGRLELFSLAQRKLIAQFLNTIEVAIDAAEAEEIAAVADLLNP